MRLSPRVLAAASVALVSSAALLVAPQASAMSDSSTNDENLHPGVVAMLVVDTATSQAFMYCSGMLIDPSVVLTASHCNAIEDSWWFEPPYAFAVTNDPELDADSNGWIHTDSIETLRYVDEVHTNPLYRGGYRDDVSAQTLVDPLVLADAAYGALPTAGLLDGLQANKTLKSTPIMVLGYGTKPKTIPASTGPAFADSNTRRSAVLPTLALDKQSIHQNQNLARVDGGACYGDSGGPSLIEQAPGQRPIVVGVTSTGDGPCFATNVSGRVDTQTALDFLDGVLG